MKKQSGVATAAGREIFEAKSGIEAAMRAGKNPNLKGIVHETMYKNIYNASPKRIIDGTKAVLSESTTAIRDDVIIKQGSNIVKRVQLKDTANSIGKTIEQVKNHHYSGTNLVGTKETVKAFGKGVANQAKKGVNVTQKMSSSGISSADTSRIATKTIGGAAGKLTASSLGKVASSSGVAGGVISGGIEAITSGIKLANGEIDGGEFVGNVAKETVGGGLSAAGGSVAATAVAAGTATLLASTTAPLWVPAAVGFGAAVAVGSAIKGIWDCIWD